MKEDFLHYLWKFQKLTTGKLYSTEGESIVVKYPGIHNELAGPDFFNASVYIGDQLWAGNVEIHLRSSHWYAHRHETDPNYDNVILHVVWEHDLEIYRKDGSSIPTLEMKPVIPAQLLARYELLFSGMHRWIACEESLGEVESLDLESWLTRLFLERLEQKSTVILEELTQSNNHWEQVLFRMLARSFGSKINGNSFSSIAGSVDFSIVQKANDTETLEALFMGQAGLLETPLEDGYHQRLVKSYAYLKVKYSLHNESVVSPSFFRLRPPNFPTIRLSQLSNLYFTQRGLFSAIIEARSLAELYVLLSAEAGPYWHRHYNFGVASGHSQRKLSQNFKDLLIINTIVPIKFCYGRYVGRDNSEEILDLISEIPAEKNAITDKFRKLLPLTENALSSQAVLQLKNEYCDKNQCLKCAIGNQILKR